MGRRAALVLLALVLPLLAALALEDARSAGCLSSAGAASCAPCHAADGGARWERSRSRPCTPYCLTCHKRAEMDQHHPVGSVLRRRPAGDYPLTAGSKTACFTCHDLSRPRYDRVRWKAASLYDRMFRHEDTYKTYFLSTRNDQGQLCLACH